MKLLSFLGLSIIIIIHFIFILSIVELVLFLSKKKTPEKYGLTDKIETILLFFAVSFSMLLSFYITFVF